MTGEIEYAIEHFGSLTTREVDVFRLTAVGFTSKQAARRLSMSHRTIENYRHRVLNKLRLSGWTTARPLRRRLHVEAGSPDGIEAAVIAEEIGALVRSLAAADLVDRLRAVREGASLDGNLGDELVRN